MAKLRVTDFFIYRWRYYIGYSLVLLALAGLLTVAGLYIPGGLSEREMTSVVESSQIDWTKLEALGIINAPYHALQQASMWVFGVTPFSIKLPSLILGFMSAVGMFFLLRRWFKHNVAVIASAVTIATGQFLFIAQEGTPSVTYIFWSVFLLLSAIMLARQSKYRGIWTSVFFLCAALSLYTPLSIYILIALASAALLHPHLRYIVKRLSKTRMLLIAFLSLILVAPLAYSIYLDPTVGLRLLGIPPMMPDFAANLRLLADQHLNIFSPSSGIVMTPIFGIGSLALILLGIMHMIRSRHTARSYIIAAWTLLLLPVLIINPEFISITFIPLLLLLATGFDTLIREWYRLFPKNPYARIAGLLPLTVLVAGLFISGVERYMYGYHYDPQTATNFSRDLRLISNELSQEEGDVILVPSDKTRQFYTVLANNPKSTPDNVSLKVSSIVPETFTSTTIVANEHKQSVPKNIAPDSILVNAHFENSDRFYIYKNTQN